MYDGVRTALQRRDVHTAAIRWSTRLSKDGVLPPGPDRGVAGARRGAAAGAERHRRRPGGAQAPRPQADPACEDRDLLDLLSAHAAIGMFAARLFATKDRKLRTLESLVKLARGE